jgi:hypothetical protein
MENEVHLALTELVALLRKVALKKFSESTKRPY